VVDKGIAVSLRRVRFRGGIDALKMDLLRIEDGREVRLRGNNHLTCSALTDHLCLYWINVTSFRFSTSMLS